MRDQLPVESLVDALQDSVHKECGGVRAVSERPPCNPMATQCPRCNNSVAECDFGRDTDLDLDDVAATSQKAKTELEELRAENERWRWLVRYASLGFDGAPSWNAVIRLPVFDSEDQTVRALVDRARATVGD